MEKSIHDLALDELHERRKLVQEEVTEQYRGKKPFRMEPVDNDTLLYIHDNMTPEDMDYAIATYGEESVNDWLYEMNKLKTRRNYAR